RRLLAAGRHAAEQARAGLAAVGAIEDRDADTAGLGDVLRDLGEVGRVHVVGGRIDEFAREPGGLGEDLATPGALRRLAALAAVGLHELQRVDLLLALLALVAIERVGAEDGALDDGVGALPRGEAVAEDLDGDGSRAEVAR